MDRIQSSLEQYTKAGEQRHATALVTFFLEKNFKLSVSDGEEWTVINSDDKTTVIHALATTDADYLRVAQGELIFTLFLVYGNASDGSELVADYSVRHRHDFEEVETLLDEVYSKLYPHL